MERDGVLICAHRRAPPHIGVRWCTGTGGVAQVAATELVWRHVDVVALQAGVELKAREAQELGGTRLVPMGTLERGDDGLALELVQRHGATQPHRFG